jgi:hypothetical protein
MTDGKVVISVQGSVARKLFEALRKYEGNTPCFTEMKLKRA